MPEHLTRRRKTATLRSDDRIYWQGFSVYGRRGCIAFNNPEFFTHNDGTDSDDLTFIRLAGKRAILRQMSFYRKYLPGFENAYISDIASSVGVRESRNIVTEYVITAEDLLSRRKFPDCICRSAYPVDIHGKTLNFSSVTPADDGKPWYELPLPRPCRKGDRQPSCRRALSRRGFHGSEQHKSPALRPRLGRSRRYRRGACS